MRSVYMRYSERVVIVIRAPKEEEWMDWAPPVDTLPVVEFP